jgi:hypothetical protein
MALTVRPRVGLEAAAELGARFGTLLKGTSFYDPLSFFSCSEGFGFVTSDSFSKLTVRSCFERIALPGRLFVLGCGYL